MKLCFVLVTFMPKKNSRKKSKVSSQNLGLKNDKIDSAPDQNEPNEPFKW